MSRPVRRYWGTSRADPLRPVRTRAQRARAAARRLFGVAGVLALLWGADRALAWARTSPTFQVRRVEVLGARNADTSALAEVAAARGVNVFRLDLGAVRERVEATPWVATATVRRVVPDGVRIEVREHAPTLLVAQERGLDLLAENGQVLERGVGADRFALPVAVGATDEAARTRAAATVAAIRRALPGYHRALRRVDASDRDRLTLHADGHPPVLVTGPESTDEIAGWLAHAAGLRTRLGGVRRVDARWSDRLFLLPGSGSGPGAAAMTETTTTLAGVLPRGASGP